MSDDPFSDLLALANARSVVSGGFTAGGAWALRFPAPGRLKFFGVARGRCWLGIDGDAPVQLAAGDVFLISGDRSFVLAADRTTDPIDARTVFASHGDGSIAAVGSGDDCLVMGGHVTLDAATGALLLDVLPQLILARRASPQATVLHWLLDQLVREQQGALPGASIASAQLAQLLFIQLLRVHVASSGPLAAGVLRAIADRRLAPALRLMHGEPRRAWRLASLAKAAAMSRTSFAVRFKAVAGMGPLAYLTAWRMRLAARALREDGTPVAVLARTLGYASESAFSHAFKRAAGMAPRHYRSAVHAGASERGSLAAAVADRVPTGPPAARHAPDVQPRRRPTPQAPAGPRSP